MAQAVRRRPLTSEARVRSQVSPCEMCAGQSGTETGFSPSTSVSPRHCHATNTPTHLRLHVALSKRTNGRSLGTSKSNALSDVEELWLETSFQFFAPEGLLSIWYFEWRRHVFCYVGTRYCNIV